MRKWLILAILAATCFGFTKIFDFTNDPAEIKLAINKSLPLLQSSSHAFLENAGGCHSCHGQGLGGVTFSLAKQYGFVVADSIVEEAVDSIYSDWKSRLAYLAQNEDPVALVMSAGYGLWALSATNYKKDKVTELLAKNIMQRQLRNGSWISPNARPPLEYYSFSATALSVRNIREHLPAIFADEVKRRVDVARNWLTNTTAIANEEKIFQLLGLKWAGADQILLDKLAKKLIETQRADGGWSQLETLNSDAYATGQSLYALNYAAGLDMKTPALQKGIAFLLKTQKEDGSWKVITRSFPSVPFVHSGFPHGDDQFISAAGSNWATMALILASK